MLVKFIEFTLKLIFKLFFGILNIIQQLVLFRYKILVKRFYLFLKPKFLKNFIVFFKNLGFVQFFYFLFCSFLICFYIIEFFIHKLITWFKEFATYIIYMFRNSYFIFTSLFLFCFEFPLYFILSLFFFTFKTILDFLIIFINVFYMFFISMLEYGVSFFKKIILIFIFFSKILKINISYLNNLFMFKGLGGVIKGSQIKDKENRDVENYLNRNFYDLSIRMDDKLHESSLVDQTDSFRFMYMMRATTYLSDIYVSEQRGLDVGYINSGIYYNLRNSLYDNYLSDNLSFKNLNNLLKSTKYLKKRSFISKSDYLYWVYPWFATYFSQLRDLIGDNTNETFFVHNSKKVIKTAKDGLNLSGFGLNTDFLDHSTFDKSNLYTSTMYNKIYTKSEKSRKSFFYNTWFGLLYKFYFGTFNSKL